ncbi:reverse transcriptase-like protein [Acidaminobacter sp. JC074]|uniref:ribonuclease H1 domain-containing protein n=1 Tax=Acidaminobacter sp. JC074 TaxID=2530199 RepID=UPI001F0F0C55|nr:ribonuclease H family protein [Acidaminobacter sp. JC074]MCH4889809.1 reverse transcriptase-like protein [Acidaminobacter sp. JC074]
MSKKKYYAVRKGKQRGIFETWGECSKQVNGFSGAEYKSFLTINEAETYLNRVDTEKEVIDYIDVYVDGSYDSNLSIYSCGVVILDKTGEVKLQENGNNTELVTMNNVAGELLGAMLAMKYAAEHSITAINIHYDYEGIRSWCTGDWKANKLGTKEYKKFYDDISKKVKVKFTKVKAHTGDYYNELADQLAKEAIWITTSEKRNISANRTDYNNYIDLTDNINIVSSFESMFEKKDSLCYITSNKYYFSEKNLNKFVKLCWKNEGRRIKEIINLSIHLDTDINTMSWVVNVKEEEFKYIIKY